MTRDQADAERDEERDRLPASGSDHVSDCSGRPIWTRAGSPGTQADLGCLTFGQIVLSTLATWIDFGDPEQPQDLDQKPGRIELVPGQAMARRGRMRVVIVVPAFAEGDQGDPPVVPGIVAGVEAARAPHVRGGVDQPGGVQPEDDRAGKMPHRNSGKSADGAAGSGQDDDRHPVVVVQPDVEAVLRQIGSVLRHHPGVVVIGLAEQDPADVRPEGAIARRMRIARLVGLLMMDAMGGHPEDRPAFERQRAANGKEILEPHRDLIGPMGVQAMIAHADAEPGGEVIQPLRPRPAVPK